MTNENSQPVKKPRILKAIDIYKEIQSDEHNTIVGFEKFTPLQDIIDLIEDKVESAKLQIELAEKSEKLEAYEKVMIRVSYELVIRILEELKSRIQEAIKG